MVAAHEREYELGLALVAGADQRDGFNGPVEGDRQSVRYCLAGALIRGFGFGQILGRRRTRTGKRVPGRWPVC